jgi:acyl carrier protein
MVCRWFGAERLGHTHERRRFHMVNDSAREHVSARIEDIIRQQVGSETPLSPETDLLNDLGIDSLELVELNLKMEKEFGKKIRIADLRGCVTIEDVTQLVQQSKTEEQVESA